MRAWHQKGRLESDFPFFLSVIDDLNFPPHWHKEIEIVYVLDGNMEMGVSNEIYVLKPRDIFFIGGGHVHHFNTMAPNSQSVIIQFGLSFFESLFPMMDDSRFIKPLLRVLKKVEPNENTLLHKTMEEQITSMIEEYERQQKGYQVALKARMYDLMVTLVRHVPVESDSVHGKSAQISQLKKLERVFEYIESNYDNNITLDEISAVANYSPYHFTRFFKETTGMTFIRYVNDFRIKIAEGYLLNIDTPTTEIAYRAGFNSIKTFNRVFKQIKGCSPTEYRKIKLG